MKTTIIIGDEKDFTDLDNNTATRHIFHTRSEAEAHLYHIEHPEVDSYIILSDHFTREGLRSLIQHVHYLNSIISIIILHQGNLKEIEFFDSKHILLCEKISEIPSLLISLPETHRDSNRTEWPVKVAFWHKGEERNRKIGNILSISSGGCFIRTSEYFEQENLLLMTIHFKEFDLFSEGKVVRHTSGGSDFQPEGLAIQFLRTSPQTKKCIQSIIDEKILGDLMKKLNPDQRSNR